MSLMRRLNRLTADVEWLELDGRLRWVKNGLEMCDLQERLYAHDPALSRRLGIVPPGKKALEAARAVPPPEPASRLQPILRDAPLGGDPQDEGVRVESSPTPPSKPPAPAQPHPEEPRETWRPGAFERKRSKRPEGWEPAPRSLPTLRDAPLRGAPQGEGVRVESPPKPPPPEPDIVQPFNYDPPPEMQIRPVRWRMRGPEDYVDDADDMYGKCIVDYDVLADDDDDDD